MISSSMTSIILSVFTTRRGIESNEWRREVSPFIQSCSTILYKAPNTDSIGSNSQLACSSPPPPPNHAAAAAVSTAGVEDTRKGSC
mmetsp:Transcript_53249/g.59546  ORF Transcript_53249/g.59546 Transcript_53249/m.59546 type:complete len:86 (-) Transcript_53249:46-303(-)